MNIGHPNAPQRPQKGNEKVFQRCYSFSCELLVSGTSPFPAAKKKVTDPYDKKRGHKALLERLGYSGWDGDMWTLRIVENKHTCLGQAAKQQKSNPHFISFCSSFTWYICRLSVFPWISENGTLILISLKNFPNFKFPCKQVLIVLCRRRHRVWLLLEQLVGFRWGGSTLLGPD